MGSIISGYLYKSKDGSSLAIVRILFGILMMVDIIQERGGSRIDIIWGDEKDCHFPLLPTIKPLSFEYMCTIYGLMWICALTIALGFYFKMSCFLFTISYWYLILLDKSYWNNHTYLYGLLAILLYSSSANVCWSVDAYLNKVDYQNTVPNWNYFLLRFQLFILYFYAGLKKTDLEWLRGYSMKYLGDHWVFDSFKYFLTFDQVDYFVIHISGFCIDISSGFLLIFHRTRPLGFLLLVPFHLMNTRLFNIGMFPYVCLATLPIFCDENWPKKILKHFRRNHTQLLQVDSSNKNYRTANLTTTLVITYCFVQLFLPWSHFITAGFNNWTPGLYGYSWDMMVHRWDSALTVVKVVDQNTNEEFHIDPTAWTLNERWSKHADMCLQYAQCVKRNILKGNSVQTSQNISIYIDVWCSLNGRFQQRMFDPNYDLLQAKWSPFEKVDWLKPLLTDYNDWRTRIAHIEDQVYSWSNYSDVMIIADFPGLEFDNFISSDLSNVTLTVLDGAVYYETNVDVIGLHLKAGEVKTDIPTNCFHRISTVSVTPSCFMYTYFNRTKEIAQDQVVQNADKIWGSPFPILENSDVLYRDFKYFLHSVYASIMKIFNDIMK